MFEVRTNESADHPKQTPPLLFSPQSVDTVCTLYHQSFQEGAGSAHGGLMDVAKDPPAGHGGGGVIGGSQTSPHRPCHKHMSATERLRKVIQELVDTEKSYVKVMNAPTSVTALEARSGPQWPSEK